MKRSIRVGLAVVGAAGLMLTLLPGCSSVSPKAPAAAAQDEDPLQSLRRGMDAAEVRIVMGEPESTRKTQVDDDDIEIWTYQRRLDSRVEMISPTMDEVPWVDPVTGLLVYVRQPAQSPKTTTRREEITLYFLNGQLAELRRTIREESSFRS